MLKQDRQPEFNVIAQNPEIIEISQGRVDAFDAGSDAVVYEVKYSYPTSLDNMNRSQVGSLAMQEGTLRLKNPNVIPPSQEVQNFTAPKVKIPEVVDDFETQARNAVVVAIKQQEQRESQSKESGHVAQNN